MFSSVVDWSAREGVLLIILGIKSATLFSLNWLVRFFSFDSSSEALTESLDRLRLPIRSSSAVPVNVAGFNLRCKASDTNELAIKNDKRIYIEIYLFSIFGNTLEYWEISWIIRNTKFQNMELSGPMVRTKLKATEGEGQNYFVITKYTIFFSISCFFH